jgi:hypothetical protein
MWRQADLPWLEGSDEDQSPAAIAAGPLADRTAELIWLDRLLARAAAVGDGWSKAAHLERLFCRLDEPAVVFSEYRDTILKLQARFESLASVAVLHGGLSGRERRESLHRFASGAARLLFATDAAGEGLNLQARCRLVVNVELPWNPLRLEQRVGRVDRLGQARRVHALNLFHPESYEDTVRMHLQARIARLGAALHGHDVERAIEAALFGGSGNDAVVPGLRTEPVRAQPADAVAGVALQRKAAALAEGSRHSVVAPPTLCARPRRVASEWMLLFDVRFRDRTGHVIGRDLLPIVVTLHRRLRVAKRDGCAFARALAENDLVAAALRARVAARLDTNAQSATTFGARVMARARAIGRRLDATRLPTVQHSLFDRRAEQQACERAFARDALRNHLAHLGDVLDGLNAVIAESPSLIAAWPLGSE